MKTGTVLVITLAVAFTLGFPLSAIVTKATSPNLLWIRDYTFAPYMENADQYNQYGKLNVLFSISKLLGDTSSAFDWYFYAIQVQSVPGHVAYPDNRWEISYHGDVHTVAIAGTNRWLADYSPTTTDGYSTSTVSASVTVSDKPAFSFSVSDSYQIPYVKVLDYGDYSVQRAQWQHVFNYAGDPVGAPSDSSFLVRPRLVEKTTQDSWSLLDAYYEVEWTRWDFGWELVRFLGNTQYVDAQRSGDS